MSILKTLGKAALEIAKAEISKRAKIAQLELEALPLTQDNLFSLKIGDFVRDASSKLFYMVVKPKTKTENGILTVLQTSSVEWYYRLEYDPYIGALARNCSNDPASCSDIADTKQIIGTSFAFWT